MKRPIFLSFLLSIFMVVAFSSCEETLPQNQNLNFQSYKQKVDNAVIYMIAVPEGNFEMGATKEHEKDALEDEYPVHRVYMDRYYLSATEVTQDLYEAVMQENPSANKGPQLPVENVSYEDAVTFCKRLSAMSRREYKLPTEAQWEFAARSRNSSLGFPFAGASNLNYQGWYALNSDSISHIVGYKAPNSLGMMDMSGNVSEWCADWYGPYAAQDSLNPVGPETGTLRVVRGGSYLDVAADCRIARRMGVNPAVADSTLGFRIVSVAPEKN